MKRLIVHIGMPKTASTTLQSFLFSNSETLKKFGIFYSKSLHHNNVKFYPLFFDKPYDFIDIKKFYSSEDLATKAFNKFRQEWIAVFNSEDYSDLIISSEYLYLCTKSQVVKIKNFINGYFDDIKIICYIRDPKSYLKSQIQEGIKSGYITNDNFDNLITEYSKFCRYYSYLKIG